MLGETEFPRQLGDGLSGQIGRKLADIGGRMTGGVAAAFGIGHDAKPPEWREGVRWDSDSQTDMLRTIRSSSGNARMAVALPSSVWKRHTKPVVASATALIGSSASMNSATSGESTGARRRPTLIWASWKPSMGKR